jgi:hypothetical protein
MAGITNERLTQIQSMTSEQLTALANNCKAILSSPTGVTQAQRDTANDEMAAIVESAGQRGLTL